MNDFLSDVNAAVDGTSTPATPATPAVPTTPAAQVGNASTEQSQQNTSPQTPATPSSREKTLEDDLTSMFDGAAATEIGGTEAIEPKEVLEEKNEKTAEKPDKQEKPASRSQGKKNANERLLDTFLKEDDNGNLLNNDGDIIALAGKSRTYYEGLRGEARKQRTAAETLAGQNLELSRRFAELYDEYKSMDHTRVTAAQSIVKETSFSDNEATNAIALMKQYKQDPIAAIKSLLTQAQASGIDVTQIGANITANPADMRQTMQTMLEEHTAPQREQENQDRIQAEANKEANAFLQTFPEAENFHVQISQAKMRYPKMSLQEIWFKLKPHIRQPQAQQQQQQQAQDHTMHGQEQQKQAPVVRKRRRVRNAVPKVVVPTRDYGNMSFADIANSIKKDNT